MKKLNFILTLVMAGFLFNGCDKDEEVAAVLGCMDSAACNYDANATEDDGSCYDNDMGCGCDQPGPTPGYDCNDNCLSTYMDDNMEYDLDGMAFVWDYGFYYDDYDYGYDENWNYDLYLLSDGFYWGDDDYLAGSGNYFYFEMFFENGFEGTYAFNEDWGYSETFRGFYANNIDAGEDIDDDGLFTGGSVTITSLGGDNYEVSFECLTGAGEDVNGCFTGQIDFWDYYYARNQKPKNNNPMSIKEKIGSRK